MEPSRRLRALPGAQLFTIRFAWLLVFFQTFPAPLWRLPLVGSLQAPWHAFSDAYVLGPFVRFAARHVFHVGLRHSSWDVDTVDSLVALGCIAVFAALAAALWTAVSQRTENHDRILEWLRTYLCLYAGATIAAYGVEKMVLHQMGYPPNPGELMTPTMNLTPQRLLWVLMATSPTYQVFTGTIEAVGGVLIMIRRTRTIGASICVAAMLNVVVMDWAYHVQVVFLATQLLVVSAFVLAPEARRLWNALVLDRAVPAARHEPLFSDLRRQRIASTAIAAFVVWTTASSAWGYITEVDGHWSAKPPFYGAYVVESFARNGSDVSPLANDPRRWRLFVVSSRYDARVSGAGMIYFMPDDLTYRFLMNVDPVEHTITFRSPPLRNRETAVFHFEQPDPDHLVLTGVDALPRDKTIAPPLTDSLRITLKRVDVSMAPLLRPRPRLR